MKTDNKAIILFDGECKLCTGSIRFISHHDRKEYFTYISLKSEAADKIINKYGIDLTRIDSVFLIMNEKVMTYSTAVLTIARYLSGWWPFFYVFIIIPKILRDSVYKLIAIKRHKWFDKLENLNKI